MTDRWNRRKLLVWGTTYPEFSKKYYETVCTGAVDGETGKLVRLYPITLRYQEAPFRLYQWIEGDIQRNPSDRRPESYRIRQQGITVLDQLDTKVGWRQRSEWVLRDGNVVTSVEALWRAQEKHGTSLGLVKPKEVTRIYVDELPESDREAWEHQREAALSQKDLFVDVEAKTKDLAFMPIRYHVVFECSDSACRGHDMSLLDWGTYVLSRRQFAKKGKAKAEEDVIEKLRSLCDHSKKDLYLFLGNSLAHPKSFMIVGLYYPPLLNTSRTSRTTNAQPTLPGLE